MMDCSWFGSTLDEPDIAGDQGC